MTHNKLQIQQNLVTEAHQSFKGLLLRYSMSKLKNKTLAEDVVQDTFIRVWDFIFKGGEIENMKPFLYRVLHNLIVNEYRRPRTRSLDDLVEEGFEPVYEGTERMVNVLDGRTVVLFIEKLPPKYREVLSLRYKENLSIGEISDTTRQSKNAVTVQIHRGLKKLKFFLPEFQMQNNYSIASR